MSEQDRKDWNEDMEFDSLADDRLDDEIFDDSVIGFADYEDEYQDAAEGDSPGEEALASVDRQAESMGNAENNDSSGDDQDSAPVAVAFTGPKRPRKISSFWVGVSFILGVLISAGATGWGLLRVTGIAPMSLWQVDGLQNFEQAFDFTAHPMNFLYLMGLGVFTLGVIGSVWLARSAAAANERTRQAENMLDRLTALTMDNQGDWMDVAFKEFPPAENFVSRILGAFRLQETRQMRLVGLEGELHRLQKALAANSRADLTGRFDHPSAGALSDEMVRYFDDRDNAVKEAEQEKSHRYDVAGDYLDQLQGVRRLNAGSLENSGIVGMKLDGLASSLKSLVETLDNAAQSSRQSADGAALAERIKNTLGSLSASQETGGSGVTAAFNDMVDRGNKLAFQIAMEVARLGPRGERLLPMTKALEELTAEFRQAADEMGGSSESGDSSASALERVFKGLDELSGLLEGHSQDSMHGMADQARASVDEASEATQTLVEMADGFKEQDSKLCELGESFAHMTDATFDRGVVSMPEVDVKPIQTMNLARQDNLAKRSAMKPLPAAPPPSPFHGQDSILNPSGGFSSDHPVDDAPLSAADETVYDLDAFGGTPLDLPADEPAEEVFELSSFGASPLELSADEPVDEPVEEVFELSSFGASPLELSADEPADEPAEEVFELSSFGASPLELSVDEPVDEPADEPADEPEEEVFELSSFGASPMEPEEKAPAEDVYDLSDFGATPMQ